MQNIVLTIAYDGTSFLGWQMTNMGPSIEGSLKKPLEQILQEEIHLQAASRTDAGVHAVGQVVNFFSSRINDFSKLKQSLNALLPKTIVVLDVRKAPLSFHPTLDTIGKEYTYEICQGSIQLPIKRHWSWHVPYHLDLEKMRKGSTYLIGEHDFSSFCNQRKNLSYDHKSRTLFRCTIEEEGSGLKITIAGNHFLYKMMRNIVGTLVYVGRGKILPEEIPLILSSKSRPLAGVTAPAHGLVLKNIFYPQEILS